MTWFLAYWLAGESFYFCSTRLTRGDLATMTDLLEDEALSQIVAQRPIGPEERERLRKICGFAVGTFFFVLPLFWPLVLMPDDDDLFG